MEQSSTTTQKKTMATAPKIRFVSCRTVIDLKTRKEQFLRSERFILEFYGSIGISVQDISKDCITIVPFSNITYIQLEG